MSSNCCFKPAFASVAAFLIFCFVLNELWSRKSCCCQHLKPFTRKLCILQLFCCHILSSTILGVCLCLKKNSHIMIHANKDTYKYIRCSRCKFQSKMQVVCTFVNFWQICFQWWSTFPALWWDHPSNWKLVLAQHWSGVVLPFLFLHFFLTFSSSVLPWQTHSLQILCELNQTGTRRRASDAVRLNVIGQVSLRVAHGWTLHLLHNLHYVYRTIKLR